jgi:hypothetical protein
MTSLNENLAKRSFAVTLAAVSCVVVLAAQSSPAASATTPAITTASAAQSTSLLPAVAASQSFAVATKVELPFHGGPSGGGAPGGGPTGGSGQGGPPGGGPPPSGGPPGGAGGPQGGPPGFPHDESGTLTLNRTTHDAVRVTASGDLDAVDSSFAVDASGAVTPGSSPNRYIVAFDNASAIGAQQTAALKAGDAWNATAQILTFGGPQTAVPLAVKVVSVSGGVVTLAATGNASITVSTPRGDRPADLAVDADMQVASGKLRSYSQKLSQTVKTPRRTFTLSATTTLTSN